MPALSAFICGMLFGIGLLLSGMANPAKVSAFLDLAGAWDPSLALVMAGAIGVAFPAFHWAKRQQQSLLHQPMALPPGKQADKPLVIGAIVFGIGWGLAGYCPGPALASLLYAGLPPLLFTVAMLAGLAIGRYLLKSSD